MGDRQQTSSRRTMLGLVFKTLRYKCVTKYSPPTKAPITQPRLLILTFFLAALCIYSHGNDSDVYWPSREFSPTLHVFMWGAHPPFFRGSFCADADHRGSVRANTDFDGGHIVTCSSTPCDSSFRRIRLFDAYLFISSPPLFTLEVLEVRQREV